MVNQMSFQILFEHRQRTIHFQIIGQFIPKDWSSSGEEVSSDVEIMPFYYDVFGAIIAPETSSREFPINSKSSDLSGVFYILGC